MYLTHCMFTRVTNKNKHSVQLKDQTNDRSAAATTVAKSHNAQKCFNCYIVLNHVLQLVPAAITNKCALADAPQEAEQVPISAKPAPRIVLSGLLFPSAEEQLKEMHISEELVDETETGTLGMINQAMRGCKDYNFFGAPHGPGFIFLFDISCFPFHSLVSDIVRL
ncbi:hypothetical protein SERLA73DRAFT_148839 [Serpula lacrymans var. lacrymans S7.3]|uniref:Uncharacterized protein n=1 Tax=Serpula lacrymans var. lacrymans (strain S7.3) TaxID=936435 RepID=F8PFP5_SERL3|nr:hypothetical protein SERLA73DRAFT_148839 [Serpula lacrymans var. lacrymans S7.3]